MIKIKRLVTGLIIVSMMTANTSMVFANSDDLVQTTVQTEYTKEKTYMKVNTGSLTVRSGPSTSNRKIGSLSKGTKVEVVSKSGTWYKIVYKSGYGWCSGSYLVSDNSSGNDNNNNNNNGNNNGNNDNSTQVKQYMKVNTSSLVVRSGPSTSNSKIGSLSKGTKVEVVAKSGTWYKIVYKKGYGWCSGAYLISDNSSGNDNNNNNNNNGNNDNNSQNKQYMKVNTTSLVVRSGPSTSNSKIGSLSKGTRVEVVSKSGIWCKIVYKSGYGWCSGDYLVSDNSSGNDNNNNNNNGNTQVKKYMKVNTSTLNVRSGPSTTSSKIGSLSKGTKVEVVEESGIWCKIVYKNGYGWCSSDYLIKYSSSNDNETNNKLSKGHYIVIKTSNNTMAYYKDGKLVSQHRVATGKRSTPTPKGKFKLVNKIKNRPYYSGGIPGGDPRNPLGKRWLGLQVGATYGTTYAIHGNNNENSIGGYVSGGCIRMHNKEVEWLYDQVPIGTQVIISSSSETFSKIASSYKINLE